MKALNRLLYPRTDSGRRRYIRDGLKPPRGKVCYWIAILLGLVGLVVSFVICIHDNGSFLLSILSMLVILLGATGIGRRSE